jgi:hypothetical protein
MKKTQEKSKIYNIHVKVPTPPQTKANHKLPLNQAIWMANIKFQTQEGSKQNTRFLNAKDHTPPKPKAKHNKRQTQSKTPTPSEVENPRFYQMSLGKPQDKHMPLKQ